MKDFDFLDCEYHYRILRNGNMKIFENFVDIMKEYKNPDEDNNSLIFKCLCQIERFFYQQYSVYYVD